jgi:hypothetical protein
MTLASTDFSLGSVNTEMNVASSTTAITLNQTNVRMLANKLSGAIQMADLRATSYNYGLVTKPSPDTSSTSRFVGIDPTNKYYYVISNDTSKAVLTKINIVGAVVWQVQYSTNPAGTWSTVTVSPSGYVYIGGYDSTNSRHTIWRVSPTDGSIVWQKEATGSSSTSGIQSLDADSSDNIYYTYLWDGAGSGAGSTGIGIGKINSSGTAQWSQDLNCTASATFQTSARNISVDSSGNAYISGGQFANSSNIALKVNSSGTLQWAKTWSIGTNVAFSSTWGGTCDSSGNTYCFGTLTTTGSAAYVPTLMKLDTSGNYVWSVSATNITASAGNAIACCTDSSGNIYGVVITSSTTYIFKWNSSGTIQFETQITNASNSNLNLAIAMIYVDETNNNLIVNTTATTSSVRRSFLFSLPLSGAVKSGSITLDSNTFGYSTASNTYVTNSFSVSSVTNITQASSVGLTNTSTTSSSATLTPTKAGI